MLSFLIVSFGSVIGVVGSLGIVGALEDKFCKPAPKIRFNTRGEIIHDYSTDKYEDILLSEDLEHQVQSKHVIADIDLINNREFTFTHGIHVKNIDR